MPAPDPLNPRNPLLTNVDAIASRGPSSPHSQPSCNHSLRSHRSAPRPPPGRDSRQPANDLQDGYGFGAEAAVRVIAPGAVGYNLHMNATDKLRSLGSDSRSAGLGDCTNGCVVR